MRKYPLQSLHQQRERTVNRDAEQLGKAKQQVEQAVTAHQLSKSQRETAAERARRQRQAEAERAQSGLAKASDLLQQAKHDARRRTELAELHQAETQAADHLERAQQQERERLEKLRQSAAEAKATERHRRRWQQEERKRVVRRDDERAHDAWHGAAQQSGLGKSGPKRSGER